MAIGRTTILIVDDDPLIRETFRYPLEQKGYRVLVADDGDEAMATIASSNVDVVLLDILMPNKEGLETLLEIKRRFPGAVVHVMSGGGSRNKTDFLTIAVKFGADGVIRKPFTARDLLRLIESGGNTRIASEA
ncbi:MAG TPA: response regulator [Rhizomicrobium sp.]|jgi:DNA-binding response OmpR family regulator|nr:response regulator [Rhizomicrobium sp.]